MLSLTPEELRSLINRGLITPPKPVELSLSTLRNRAWRECNPDRYAEYRAKAKEKSKKEQVMA